MQFRTAWAAALLGSVVLAGTLPAADDPPFLYDIVINGETFTVEGNRAVTVESRLHQGVKYDIALRLSQTQRWPLNTVQFDYDLGFEVADDEDQQVRTATLRHELGFTVTVTDMGGPLPEKSRKEMLDRLIAAMTKRLAAEKATDVKMAKPMERKFKQTPATGVTITYGDQDGFSRVCVIYLLSTPTFFCACTLECFEPDKDDAMPLVQRTLESFRPN